jgi:hypothetical protein
MKAVNETRMHLEALQNASVHLLGVPGQTQRTCQNALCKSKFSPKRDWQYFCSDKCRKSFWRRGHKDDYMSRTLSEIRHMFEVIESRLRRLEEGGGR